MADIATALDHVLGDPKTESKFQALKVLHAKKIKSLMGSIDSQQKEIGKLKTLSKDNRRTQIIQSLKKKIREQELVSDVLKEEFEKKLAWNRQEVNEFVIRKTISGPKRFRPLTREELENQIAELEKKTKSKLSGGSNPTLCGANSKRSIAQNSAIASAGTNSSRVDDKVYEDPAIVLKISELQESAMKIQLDCDRKEAVIGQLREEISRVRAINSQLLAAEEERDVMERQYNDLSMNHGRVVEELEDALQKLAIANEECFQLRAQSELELEQQTLELETLRDQCEKGLTQNTALLRRMADLEASRGSPAGKGRGDHAPTAMSTEDTGASARQTLLQEKLRAANARIAALESQPNGADAAILANVDSLKSSLREKNEAIRELKRTIAELSRMSRGQTRKGEDLHNSPSGNYEGSVADSKHVGKELTGSKSAKQLKDGTEWASGAQPAVVKLADQLIEYELNMLQKSDTSHNISVDSEMVNIVNGLLLALNDVMNLQLRNGNIDGLDKRTSLHPKKLQLLEHQILMKYDVPGVSFAGDDEDETLQGEVL